MSNIEPSDGTVINDFTDLEFTSEIKHGIDSNEGEGSNRTHVSDAEEEDPHYKMIFLLIPKTSIFQN